MNQEFFKISSGLKDIIGSELITDNNVAIFELVKNSFDANATVVNIKFDNIYSDKAKIIIEDNGDGMDYNDLVTKWLFVAYSAKKEKPDDVLDYRNKIMQKRYFAGAKGVGRFSCDRLGKRLNLITIKKKTNAKIENIKVNWEKFEVNQTDQFIEIPVEHHVLQNNDYSISHGTILEISGIIPNEWNRENFIKLKEKLSMLIKPDLNNSKNERQFKIFLTVLDEMKQDKIEILKHEKKGEGHVYRKCINGEIKNFIFDDLDIKTTKILSCISDDGQTSNTNLVDRDMFIYDIKEQNKYSLLKNISITLYFLNRSAKLTFSKKMGIEVVNYGSVLVYKNGFRILPFGEPRDDTFGIDARAMQGYSRHLGLRNIIGQIDIIGEQPELKETTSRDGGLVKTKTYRQIIEYLFETLKRLEKYVVDVTEWGVNDDNIENINSEIIKNNLVKFIANITDDKLLKSINYNKDIVKIIDNVESNSTKKIIKNFKRIASEYNDKKLFNDAVRLEKTVESALIAKEASEKEVEIERTKKNIIADELEQQIGETLFARAVVGTDTKELLSIQHHINRSSANHITFFIVNLIEAIKNNESKENLLNIVNQIAFENKKITTLSNFVTKANFNTSVKKIKADLIKFINEYAINVYQEYVNQSRNCEKINISISNSPPMTFTFSFKPIEIIIIIDNLLSNSYKAKAKNIKLLWEYVKDSEILLNVIDDGIGIPDKNVEKIFEFRFSTTDGSGLGLYHTKQVIESMGGSISVDNKIKKGVKFILRFKK